MKILAIDSTGAVASVSILDNCNLIGEYSINNKMTHSQKLMPMVDQLLKNLDLSPTDIDVFACAIGPGSFTGLRIGISIIKGMAQALNKPVIGIPTLDGLARNLSGFSGLICPLIDAKNDNVYTSIYSSSQIDSDINLISDYMAVNIHELLPKLHQDKPIAFVGDGIYKFEKLLQEEFKKQCFFPVGSLILQRSASIGYLAYQKAMLGKFESPNTISPLYLRASQAERMLENKCSS